MPTTLDEARGVDAGILEDAAAVLQLLDRQPRPAAVNADLPGRAVDIVHAAMKAAGREVFAMSVTIGYRPEDAPEIEVCLMGESPGRPETLTLFAQLGIAAHDVTIVPLSPDSSLGRATADVPGVCRLNITTTREAADPDPEPTDPTALIAEVDAARAAADEQDEAEADEDDGAAHRALVGGILGALADSQAAIDARRQGGEGE
jgi:hypothetical protein